MVSISFQFRLNDHSFDQIIRIEGTAINRIQQIKFSYQEKIKIIDYWRTRF